MTSHDGINAGSSADRLATWLVRQAALRAPGSLGERLAEEYQADMGTQRSALARLRFAVGCYWASFRMAHDPLLCDSRQIVAAGGPPLHSLLAAHDVNFFSRRTTVLLVILAVHGAAIYALVSGLSHDIKAAAPPPKTVGRVIVQPLVPERPPRRISDTVPRPDDLVRAEKVPFNPVIVTVPDNAITVEFDTAPPYVGPPPTHSAKRVSGGPGAGYPNTRDFYSSDAILLGQAGASSVRVCVDGRGRLTADPVIAASSGYPILDRDALKLARAGSGHYRSTTEDGVAIADCYNYRIRFQLH